MKSKRVNSKTSFCLPSVTSCASLQKLQKSISSTTRSVYMLISEVDKLSFSNLEIKQFLPRTQQKVSALKPNAVEQIEHVRHKLDLSGLLEEYRNDLLDLSRELSETEHKFRNVMHQADSIVRANEDIMNEDDPNILHLMLECNKESGDMYDTVIDSE